MENDETDVREASAMENDETDVREAWNSRVNGV
jgi:hypothetical protein